MQELDWLDNAYIAVGQLSAIQNFQATGQLTEGQEMHGIYPEAAFLSSLDILEFLFQGVQVVFTPALPSLCFCAVTNDLLL